MNASGAFVSTAGRWMPMWSRRLVKYPVQLTATADADTPYSSTMFQPMNHATSSPSVAYAYEYELPDIGISVANSA